MATMVRPKSQQEKSPQSKTHKRSRTGCFTCRLRRKKCDEGKPCCKACKHLGLNCEYKRPIWWGNGEQRRRHKENIKMIIKRTKLTEKVANMAPQSAVSTPGLSSSVPTSDSYSMTSDDLDRTRSVSIDSQYSFESVDFQQENEFSFGSHMHQPQAFNPFNPFDTEMKTERQTFINDIPTRRDSTISQFNSFVPSAPHTSISANFPADLWVQQEDSTAEETAFNFFDFSHAPTVLDTLASPSIQVDDCDRRLLDHFIDHVIRLIFPILDLNQQGLARSEVIIPALQSNKTYLHCCLSISALHLKATQCMQGEWVDNEIMRHRYATISELCEALNRDTDHLKILEATLGMIFFQCAVGRPDDALPDIPWHQHFQAATSLISKLDLPRLLTQVTHSTQGQPPFNMTLAAWIDILGATMVGRAPQFADTYREQHLSDSPSGLAELMGCDDRVMYIISEIACLEGLKHEGMDPLQLCEHIKSLAHQIDRTEPGNTLPSSGPRELTRGITAAFRLAARIYLCSLVPGFNPKQQSVVELVNRLTDCLNSIPAGPEGFDRSLVWPMLIGGSAATMTSPFRQFFRTRVAALGGQAEFGSFCRTAHLLHEVWAQLDAGKESVHWRDVMQQKGWDSLLI